MSYDASASRALAELATQRNMSISAVQRLLKEGADPFYVPNGSNNGVSAIVHASTRASAAVAREIFDACIAQVPDTPAAKQWLDRNLGRGMRLVHVAARLGWADAIATLRERGATLTGRDDEKQMPLRHATDAPATPGSASPEAAAEVLLASMRMTRPNHEWDAAAISVDLGGGMTLAHACAGAGLVDELAGVLRAAGEKREALLNKRDNEDRTPLILAAQRGHAALIEVLLESGARASVEALQWSCLNGHASAARALIKGGADPGELDGEGLSCADYARDEGWDDLAHEIEALGRCA